MSHEVRAARPDELAAMQAVAVAAGERFREIDDERIARCADDAPIGLDDLATYQVGGRALVAVDDEEVVGFVVFDILGGRAHIEEVAVLPSVNRRGHGSALLDAVSTWAAAAGLDGLTLTTFADVPWNRPYYERRGFRVLTPDELTPGLRAKRADEAAHGLLPELRVVMRRAR
jgi:GNAT superfamily N-acetyltransferase